jgi:two-component system, OmpR family, sensor histidine kinase MtrB
VAFALVGFVLSVALAFVTYSRSRSFLLNRSETIAVQQVSINGQSVASNLRAERNAKKGLSSVLVGPGTEPLLYRDGSWTVLRADVSADQLPESFLRNATDGVATVQRFSSPKGPLLAIAVPIPGFDRRSKVPVDDTGSAAATGIGRTAYVEISSLGELERTLQTLATGLAVGAVVATLLGGFLGLIASRRIMRPLGDVATTAELIEQGDLAARLPDSQDRDLTRLVSSFNRMTDSLEERIQRERRFASHVSHELRSPLTSLRGAVDLVANRREELSDRAQLGVELLEKDVRRFERIVLDLLEIARIEAGAASVDLVSMKVAPLVRSVLSHVNVEPEVMHLEGDVGRCSVLVDPRRIERVIANLVENATNHAGGVKAVRIQKLANNQVAIHVDDSGPGVPFSERERIFERFARGGRGRHLPGAGLGLSLVTEHLRLMNGSVSVSDSPEFGARFTVMLPVQKDEQ